MERVNTEQWKSGGDCKACRRRTYCKKQCRENRMLSNRRIREALMAALKKNSIPTPDEVRATLTEV